MRGRAAAAVAVLSLTLLGAARAEDFYRSRVRIGEAALAAGRAAEAADDLRVASFGLLDAPRELASCLAALAVAQSRAGRSEDAAATLDRFHQVQALFPDAADLSALSSDVKTSFAELARAHPRAGRPSGPGPGGERKSS